ncbi:hypothetical protein [Jeotgalibacillus marinus]|uniref:Uncharacterized protein n=1 Tax=Jeotgalibacillus marinus TaxID=86667 RepID=A0ABV3Q743_9BACL
MTDLFFSIFFIMILVLIVGLIKPTLFKLSRLKITAISLSIMVVSLAIGASFAPDKDEQEEATQETQAGDKDEQETELSKEQQEALRAFNDDVKPFMDNAITDFDFFWEEQWTNIWSDISNDLAGDNELLEAMDKLEVLYDSLWLRLTEYEGHHAFEDEQKEKFDTVIENFSAGVHKRNQAVLEIWTALDSQVLNENILNNAVEIIEEGDDFTTTALVEWTMIKKHFEDME